MKTGIELNITPIKPSTKYSNKEMDKLLSDINEKLYYFRNRFINKRVKEYLLKEIEITGKKLKNIPITVENKQLTRRQEILGELRKIYQNLKSLVISDIVEEENLPETEKSNKFMVALYLKDKRENNLTTDKMLDWLKQIHIFSNFYPVLGNLKSVNEEIIKYFKIE